ncbi:hypothetical protein JB92DRAFT_3100421 [Gautieria morchelliformis]|nr:hypothetical protein JB92DRAFT_3100421 [Gautieria morchelliformis]
MFGARKTPSNGSRQVPIPQQKENHIYAALRLFLSLLSPHPPLLPSPHQRSTMVSPTTLLHIPPLEPPTPHPFTSTSPSSRAPSPSRPPAQLQPRMQPAHRARCAMRSSRQWPCFFAWQAESRYPQSQCPQRAGQGLDMDTRPGPQGDRALPVRIQPTDTTPLMETHPRRTVGTKSSIGERRGLAISGQKDQKQLLSVWLCKISESVLICAD